MFYRKELVLKAEKMIQSWDIFAPKGNLFFVTHALKELLTSKPLLKHFDDDKKVFLTMMHPSQV
jgi:hypothetical protein